ncbi:MAG TPA: Fe-S cluster assembly protein HesB [Armatimonadota bacterium]|nr:Fe-S cluster assembly protein HesB [Armatimonadota bacterium]
MIDLVLPVPAPFHFRDVVFSHGWLYLLPFRWNAETGTLSRAERLPSGRPAQLQLSGAPGGVRLRSDAPEAHAPALVERVRWMLALDEEFSEFHALCAGEPGLRHAAGRGQGRILRSPTVWEDVVKTLFSVNTTWGQTVGMTRNLVELCGEPHAAGDRCFPEPAAVAAVPVDDLQRVCRVGYRAEPLSRLARGIVEGRIDLEGLKDRSLPTAEVEARLRALRGIGPYAAANVLMLLGHYDHLPVDSWFRDTVRGAWFGGRETHDRDLVAAFDRFRPYRTLVYRFYDWNGSAAHPESA